MPLFSSRRKDTPTPSPVRSASPNGSRGLFSRSSRPTARAEDRSGSSLSESSTRHTRPHDSYDSGGSHRNETDTDGRRSRGLFGRRRARSFDRHDLAHDQTLLNARARVADAEAAERGADAALNAARSAIREARDHVKMLEREAVDEYGLSRPLKCGASDRFDRGKRAKRKQAEARNVRKTARHLGRHG
jgi:hypothetical protein